jgi:hypothetical protein
VSAQSPDLVALAAIAFILCLLGLVFCIVKLVAGNRADLLASAPLHGAGHLALGTPGEVVVMVEAPRMSTDYRDFQIQLLHRQTGHVTTLKYSYAGAQTSVYGVTTVQVPFGRFDASAGVYDTRIAGLAPGSDYSRYRLILSRPYIGRMAIQIVGIVLCGVGMLGSVIWACWLMGWMKPA